MLQKSIRAGAASEVFNTLYDLGEFVGAQQPVVVLLFTENNKIVFFVPERFLSLIKIGSELIFDCDSCQNSYPAKISFISPSAEFTPPVIFSQKSGSVN